MISREQIQAATNAAAGEQETRPERPGSNHDRLRTLLVRVANSAEMAEHIRRVRPEQANNEIERLVDWAVGKAELPAVPVVQFDDLSGITDPDAGRVEWYVEDFIPKAASVVIGADKKIGKSLLLYHAIVQTVFGRTVFDQFAPADDVSAQIWQFEMPQDINLRRLRKTAIGLGIDPAELINHPRLKIVSQPSINLCDEAGRYTFLKKTEDADIILLDCVTAAFPVLNQFKAEQVQQHLEPVLNPLTKAGKSVLLIHHKRKRQQGAGEDFDGDAILGSQRFQSIARRIYTMSRVGDESTPGEFVTRLSMVGAWDMTEAQEITLKAQDELFPEGPGITIRKLSNAELIEEGAEKPLDQAKRLIREAVEDVTLRRTRKELKEHVEAAGVTPATFGRAYRDLKQDDVIDVARDDSAVVKGRKW